MGAEAAWQYTIWRPPTVVNSGKEYERGALSLVSADSLPISDRDLLLEYPMDEFFSGPKYEL